MTVPNKPPKGFKDVYNKEAWLENVVSQALTNLHYSWGYQLLKLPIIERETSFSKEVVGSSPWPEWNDKNCIPVMLDDYDQDYRTVGSLNGLLIPEGTVSVARWLSTIIEKEGSKTLPLKIMYNCPCFRNENIESLVEGHKLRQFDQFGMEILGSSSQYADVETMFLIVEGLEHLGVNRKDIVVRLGDIRLFNALAKESKLNEDATIYCKSLMDEIAESRAKGDNTKGFKTKLFERINYNSLDSELQRAWSNLSDVSTTQDLLPKLSKKLESDNVENLIKLSKDLEGLNVKSILDLAVVRSHEYYTSVVMEVDVYAPNHTVIEIAGGGRYDRLISPFTKEEHEPIPAIGYAYGLQRVCSLLNKISASDNIEFTMRLNSEQKVLLPQSGNPIEDYKLAGRKIKEGFVADVFLGANSSIEEYADRNDAVILR